MLGDGLAGSVEPAVPVMVGAGALGLSEALGCVELSDSGSAMIATIRAPTVARVPTTVRNLIHGSLSILPGELDPRNVATLTAIALGLLRADPLTPSTGLARVSRVLSMIRQRSNGPARQPGVASFLTIPR
ncbi:hypothetical protein [Phytohabitans aurantiacus]|uniref:Uncharacterized protein n=1 Tax=Phytohabitans aurantiacus TaxID=3016789 RepID=A0ABQ5RAK3_9ACTN|nr:hypothetical protein [Phytohabitans aurantiacus]GLI02937.1 hypothetical protein Pa4123_82150 [Phytohabitans aurantiacus]